jgi:hypothetical protein
VEEEVWRKMKKNESVRKEDGKVEGVEERVWMGGERGEMGGRGEEGWMEGGSGGGEAWLKERGGEEF